jgi:hypothetical protein
MCWVSAGNRRYESSFIASAITCFQIATLSTLRGIHPGTMYPSVGSPKSMSCRHPNDVHRLPARASEPLHHVVRGRQVKLVGAEQALAACRHARAAHTASGFSAPGKLCCMNAISACVCARDFVRSDPSITRTFTCERRSAPVNAFGGSQPCRPRRCDDPLLRVIPRRERTGSGASPATVELLRVPEETVPPGRLPAAPRPAAVCDVSRGSGCTSTSAASARICSIARLSMLEQLARNRLTGFSHCGVTVRIDRVDVVEIRRRPARRSSGICVQPAGRP